MKLILTIQLLFLFVDNAFSQSLAGDWKGRSETLVSAGLKMPEGIERNIMQIDLRFILNNDSSYSVYSFSKFHGSGYRDTTVVCKLNGQFTKDSVYLEEVEVVLPKDFPPECYQKMYLKINRKKKFTELTGIWESTRTECDKAGTIYFSRKND